MDQTCSMCNAKHWIAELPQQSHTNTPRWMSCCKGGNVNIDFLREPPAFLKDLYDDMGVRAKNFRKHIRRYNSAFAFTSIECETPNSHMSNMPFTIHGQLNHTHRAHYFLSQDQPQDMLSCIFMIQNMLLL